MLEQASRHNGFRDFYPMVKPLEPNHEKLCTTKDYTRPED
jgi:hypothetical protein